MMLSTERVRCCNGVVVFFFLRQKLRLKLKEPLLSIPNCFLLSLTFAFPTHSNPFSLLPIAWPICLICSLFFKEQSRVG
ncbi:hypothetical protein VNO78_03458 [Psophocarpus tetragonolobus]|uniref:Uncharacterized protein n=1 Tax=Psophocarpus tetragonolobus TaxID=3891 RepID=A0AAN9T4D5_PSOTE